MLGSSFICTRRSFGQTHKAGEYKWLCCAGCEVCLTLYPASDRGQQRRLQEGGQEAEQV